MESYRFMKRKPLRAVDPALHRDFPTVEFCRSHVAHRLDQRAPVRVVGDQRAGAIVWAGRVGDA